MDTGAPEAWMQRALGQARQALDEKEVPIGAVLAFPDGTYLEGRNSVEKGAPFDHAEMNVLRAGIARRGRRALSQAVLYVTAEPCLMCLGAMVQARIGGLVYGCEEPRFGGIAVLRELWKQGRYPHRFPVSSGLAADECRALLQSFFKGLRD
ncbi:MAG: nucleoside deaminase [Acidobacteriota bacterium]|jgi:tRNA(adenine34) deaminase